MKIPIVDIKAQYQQIRAEISENVQRVLDSCQFILGPEVKLFEEEVCRSIGCRHAIAVANGTDAIVLALKAYGIGPGDAVITSTYTYFATAGAIARCGARPVFCDIDPKTYNLSPAALRSLLAAEDRQLTTIKAVIPVHLYGQAADMDEIRAVAKEYKLKVIEDAAQAFGATYGGRKAGALADAGTFSFYPGKNLGAYGDAGMIVTDDAAIDESLRVYRDQGNKVKYHHSVIGHNSRMDGIQAAVLRVKLKYLEGWNKKRRALARIYDEGLKGSGVVTPFAAPGREHIYHLYVVRFADHSQKERLEKALNDGGVDARTYYPIPLHLQECFEYLGYAKGDFPQAEAAAACTLALPLYPELTTEQQAFIIDLIRRSI